MEIQEIGDRLEIQDLVAAFADAVNHMNPSQLREICVPEVAFIIKGWTELQGIDAMVGFLSGMIGHWDVIFQAVSSGRLVVASETAQGSWYTTEYGRYKDGNEVFLGGLYEDQYVKVDGRWLFASRTFQGMFRRSKLAGPELKVRAPLSPR